MPRIINLVDPSHVHKRHQLDKFVSVHTHTHVKTYFQSFTRGSSLSAMKVPDRPDCLLESPPKASQSNKVEKGLRGGIFRCASVSWIHVIELLNESVMVLRFGHPLPDILGMSLAYFGNIFCIWHILGISSAYLGHISGVSEAYLGHIMGISWACLGHFLGVNWAYLGHILVSWSLLPIQNSAFKLQFN